MFDDKEKILYAIKALSEIVDCRNVKSMRFIANDALRELKQFAPLSYDVIESKTIFGGSVCPTLIVSDALGAGTTQDAKVIYQRLK